MRRRFLAFLVWTICLWVTCTASAAALVTDVNWGVDKFNVLRMVVDLSENTRYDVSIANDKELQIKVAGGLGPKVIRRGTIKSDLAKSFSVDRDQNSVTVRVPMTKKIERSDLKSFILKKDASTGRPPRIVVQLCYYRRTEGETHYHRPWPRRFGSRRYRT